MAPLETLITDRGWAMLDDLPPVLREDPDVRAVIHCYAREFDRLALTAEEVRAQFFPTQATILLRAWEASLQLTIDPVGWTDAERREEIALGLVRMVAGGTGGAWEERLAALVGAGFSYEEFDTQDPGNTVPAHTIRITLPYPPTSDRFARIERALTLITPANTDIILQSTAGFLLDESQLDQETFGGN